jgi:TolA-binding protein
MKRVVLLGMLMIVPALAAAQVPPPPPPAPPAPAQAPAARPAPAPVMPVPPTPPAVMVMPPFDQVYIDDSVRDAMQTAREAIRAVDSDAIRAAAEKARADAAEMREQMRDGMPAMWIDMQNQKFAMVGGQDSESSSYSAGLSLIQNRQYDQAINRFDRAIAQKGSHADGAWYWKAFAQYKLGKTEDALASIATLRKDFPQSRYLPDAKVLEADVRKPSIDRIDDDEIKLLAIQGIQNSDPAKAAQLAATLLSGTNSLRVKRQALYILALSDQPSAHELLLSYAKGQGNPDLQREAINYLATRRTKQPTTSSELKQIYESTQDPSIRRAIIDAYRLTGDKASLLSVASAGGTPVEIRSQAIRNLSDVAAPTDLWALYQKEEDKDLRIAMVRSFSSMGAVDQLLQIAKSDKDPSVRQQAIRSLGSQKVDKTGATLVEMYNSESDKDTKMAIISALANQNNDTGLVALARKETKDIELKRQLVTKIAEMSGRSKVAQDYLLEVIK